MDPSMVPGMCYLGANGEYYCHCDKVCILLLYSLLEHN